MYTCTLVHVGKTGEKKKGNQPEPIQYPLVIALTIRFGFLVAVVEHPPNGDEEPSQPFPITYRWYQLLGSLTIGRGSQ